jgi:hypothetical protein
MLKSDILYYSRQENMGGLDPWFESLLDNLIDQEIYPNHNVLQEIGVKLEHELKTYKNLHNINLKTFFALLAFLLLFSYEV